MTATNFRLRANFPGGVLPEVFGVLTVADPPDFRREHGLPGSILGDALRIKGWPHYPAEVVLPGVAEPLSSFAIIENLTTIERLAQDFIRPGIFWVHRGEVIQTFLGQKPPVRLGRWDAFSGRPPVTLHATGNLRLIDCPATAFLCSTPCPATKVAEAREWARRQCDAGATIISGFYTPWELEVLAILARRGANLIWVPGRDIPKTMDATFRQPMEENRLLVLSPFGYGSPSRQSKESCSVRNRFVLGFAQDRYLPHVADGSSLASELEASTIQPDITRAPSQPTNIQL